MDWTGHRHFPRGHQHLNPPGLAVGMPFQGVLNGFLNVLGDGGGLDADLVLYPSYPDQVADHALRILALTPEIDVAFELNDSVRHGGLDSSLGNKNVPLQRAPYRLSHLGVGSPRAPWRLHLNIVCHVQHAEHPVRRSLRGDLLRPAVYGPSESNHALINGDAHPRFIDSGIPLELAQHVLLDLRIGLSIHIHCFLLAVSQSKRHSRGPEESTRRKICGSGAKMRNRCELPPQLLPAPRPCAAWETATALRHADCEFRR